MYSAKLSASSAFTAPAMSRRALSPRSVGVASGAGGGWAGVIAPGSSFGAGVSGPQGPELGWRWSAGRSRSASSLRRPFRHQRSPRAVGRGRAGYHHGPTTPSPAPSRDAPLTNDTESG